MEIGVIRQQEVQKPCLNLVVGNAEGADLAFRVVTLYGQISCLIEQRDRPWGLEIESCEALYEALRVEDLAKVIPDFLSCWPAGWGCPTLSEVSELHLLHDVQKGIRVVDVFAAF